MDLANGIAMSAAAALTGASGFGQAMQQMLAQLLQSIAGMAFAEAIMEVARGFKDLADPLMMWHAPAHFLAAAKFFAVGAVAGVAGALVRPGDSSSSGSSASGGTPVVTATQTQLPAQQPVSTTNIQKFAAGGMVTSPTLSLLGDSARSSSRGQREAAIPLDDPAAVSAIVEALGGARGGGDIINFHIQGLVSPDNLDRIVRQMSRRINGGRVRLTASQALRVTKKG
jgi:hypothetical protein